MSTEITKESLELLTHANLVETVLNYDKALKEYQKSIFDLTTNYNNLNLEYSNLLEKNLAAEKKVIDLNSIITKAEKKSNKENKENKNLVDDKDTKEIERLTLENKDLISKLKTAEEKINLFSSDPKEITHFTSPKTVIQTYNIIGFENKTGQKSYGGREYTKAIAIVKLEDDLLSLNISAKELGIEEVSESKLTEEQLKYIITLSTTVGFFKALKDFINIPDLVEETFKDSDFKFKI